MRRRPRPKMDRQLRTGDRPPEYRRTDRSSQDHSMPDFHTDQHRRCIQAPTRCLGVNEDMPVDEDSLQPYGLHRRYLETFVESQFPQHLIVRLPSLVGPGLHKNVIFDFLSDNNLGCH